jgi:hypothetical protein
MLQNEVKKPCWTVYLLYNSNDVSFWKRQKHGDNPKISGCQGLELGKDE